MLQACFRRPVQNKGRLKTNPAARAHTMSLITILRAATPHDCEHIYNAHVYSVQYTCARSYNDRILAAWRSLLSPESYLDTIADAQKALWVVEYKNHIQGFFQLSGGDGHIFHHSKHIGKLQADKFNIFFLRHLKDRFLRILCHIDSLLYQRRF